jgi:ABC-2 type transport system permease protein
MESKQSSPGLGATLASEFVKLRSVRATYVEILLAVGLALGMTALICLAIGSSFDGLSPQDQAEFDPVFTSFFGTAFGGIVLIVLGVTFVSSEYTSGMIRLTLTTTPRRGRVLLAKALLIGLVTLGVGALMNVGAVLVGQAVLGTYDIETASFNDGDVRQAVLAAVLTAPVWPLLGAAMGAIMRSTASAITTILATLFAPAIFGPLFPEWWQKNVLAYLPGSANDSLLMANPAPGTLTYLEPLPAVAVLLAWMLLLFGVAYVLLKRRDV